MESQLNIISIKAREMQVTQQFKVEKLLYSSEQKHKMELHQREVDWDKAWEKKESLLKEKDYEFKAVETEKQQLKEILLKSESEVQKLQSQIH